MAAVFPKLGIVILNYNTYELTISLIKNIQTTLEYPNFEIIVVDNASKNDSAEFLSSEALIMKYTFIRCKENGGYAKGNNVGIKKAIEIGCEYVLITNNDIEFINSSTLDRLIDTINKAKNIGVVTPALISKDNLPDPPIYFTKPSFWDLTFGSYIFHRRRYLQSTDTNYPIYAPRGSCMLMKCSDILEIDFLDENTFLYFEEPILAERLKRVNKISYFCGEIKVIHNHGKTISSNLKQRQMLMHMLNSYKYYLRTYRDYSKSKVFVCVNFRQMIYWIKRILKS